MPASLTLGVTNTYAEQLEGLYVPWTPKGFPAPTVVALNHDLLAELEVDAALVESNAAALFSGGLLPADAKPLAQAYAGHQFGGFSPQLGDGRAVLIGELLGTDGRPRDLQLKGSGPTPFSRGGDGKATLGPILREYLLGEAMFHLGVPTTRVLAALTTGERVWRTTQLPGAVLARVASSHLRVGTLQFFAARRDRERVSQLVSYTLQRHYPEHIDAENPALALLKSVAKARAHLIAQWMHVGFIHGVMNTDNVTLSGETIDYGPAAFLEVYDPSTVYSSIDRNGRYAYGSQGRIGQWNLARMGEALLEVLAPRQEEAVRMVEGVLNDFLQTYEAELLTGRRLKLGLVGEELDDDALVHELLAWMQRSKQDYTLTFRRLADGLLQDITPFHEADFTAWHAKWLARLGTADRSEVAARMNAVNPLYIPRNHVVEAALDAAIGGDLAPFHRLGEVLKSPYDQRPGLETFAEPAPADFGPYQTFCGT
ncbi:MAG: YdiU family protein [Myxococcales bacterium]|nr:YdiU family protein [Myxococcales bacterium]